MKVQLENRKRRWDKITAFNKRYGHIAITRSLPFFKSSRSNAKYTHRIRYGTIHIRDGKASHACYTFWCGASGFFDKEDNRHNRLLAQPEGELCAVCEGKAIGADVLDDRMINGRPVRYEPRIIMDEVQINEEEQK